VNRKISIIFILILFVTPTLSLNSINVSSVSCDKKVTVTVNKFDFFEKKYFDNVIQEIDIDKAETIKKQFLEIENNFSGFEKIQKQINLLNSFDVFIDNFFMDHLSTLIDRIKNFDSGNFIFKRLNNIFSGPMIISHFKIGGRIQGISPLKPFFYKNFNFSGFLSNNYFDGVIGFLPVFIGYSFSPVYISIFSGDVANSYKNIYSPFFEFLFLCAGTSIAFVLNSNNFVLFEFNLDICFKGFITGFSY
jgi:hypothetical protein